MTADKTNSACDHDEDFTTVADGKKPPSIELSHSYVWQCVSVGLVGIAFGG